MFRAARSVIRDDLASAQKDPRVRAAISNKAIARRLERLEDIVSE